MVRIRLRRAGSRNAPSYRLVVADSRAPRDGRFIENLGHYNPRRTPPEIVVNGEIAQRLEPANRPRDPGGYENPIDSTLEISQSSWIVVRCFEKYQNDRFRFAHSSPVHVDVADSPPRPRRQEVDFLIRRIEDQLARSADVLPEAAMDEYRQALKIYQKIRQTACD